MLRRIGVGGMAEVYVAERRGPGGFRRQVALKVLRPHLRDAPGFAERFTREARLAAGLRHPNLVPVIDFGVEEGTAYLAMDLVDGPDLRRATLAGACAGRPLPPRLAVHIAIQVARGLAYAHRHADPDGRPLGLVHRDVSPQNVLLSRSGEVRLADFGIATAAWTTDESASDTLRGKVAYLAPEQADGTTPDARADVFALGVVLWELLAGRRLFLAPSDAETLARVRRCEVPLPPDAAPADVPAGVWAALRTALARDRTMRASTAQHLAGALAAAWPDSDRGDAAAELAAWLAEVDALEARPAPPEAAGAVGGIPAGQPVNSVTPTLVTTGRAAWPGRGAGGRVPRLASVASVVAAAALAGAVGLTGGSPPPPEDPESPTAAPPVRSDSPLARLVPPVAEAPPPPASERGGRPERRSPPPRSASLIVTSSPAGATIELDGRPMGRTPRRIERLEADRPVLLVLRLDGHRAAERSVTPSSRGPASLDVPLEPAFGLLSLDAEPWAEIAIDGVPAGPTPVLRRSVPVGRRHIRLVHPPSGRTLELVVQIDPDGDVRRRVVLAGPAEARGSQGSPAVAAPGR